MALLTVIEDIHLLIIYKLDILMILILLMTTLLGIYYYLLLNESIMNVQMQNKNVFTVAHIMYNTTDDNVNIRYD